MRQMVQTLALIMCIFGLSGCVVAKTAVKTTGAVVGGAAKATGAVVGGTVNVLTPDGDDDDQDND